MIQQLSVLVMLGICSYEDIKCRRIHMGWLGVFALEGILFCIFGKEGLSVKLITAVIPGVILLVLSLLTKGGIGQGDGMLLMVIGILLGGLCAFSIFVYAVFLSSGYALFLFLIRKKKRTYEIAFVPFLLAAFLGSLVFGNY